MAKITVNDSKIKLMLPEGFEVLPAKEALGKDSKVNGNEWIARNEEKDLMYGISWKRAGFSIKIRTLAQIAGNTESLISKRIRNYRKIADITRTIGGKPACGFRYAYGTADGAMIADYILVKYDGKYYAFSYRGKQDKHNEYYSIFKSMLDTVEFG